MTEQNQTDYDSPWKEALDNYLPEFIAFFFPEADQEINWSRGYETLDKELQKVVQDANLGKRLADKLIKVWLKDGQETLVIIHIEIQGQYESDFVRRMYVYHYRIYDKYSDKNTDIVSLAVLGDNKPNWRPHQYHYRRWGCEMTLKFPIVKLIDFRDNWEALEQNNNPFAIIVMAYLESEITKDNPQQRLENKLSLVRRLYERGYTREEIIGLFRLIDWMMILPEELKHQFTTELVQYEEERKMPYITSIEQIGIQKGIEQGIVQGIEQGIEQGIVQNAKESVIEVLETRFDTVPNTVRSRLAEINDLSQLKELLKRAITVRSFEAFQQLLTESEN